MIHQKGSWQELIIFTRYPTAGLTKTRLIPELGPEGAAQLQRVMTERIVRTAMPLHVGSNLHLAIYYTGGSQQQMQEWLGNKLSYSAQQGVDLGHRMHNAFADAWQREATLAVLIGSDCPDLDAPLILEAIAALRRNDLVLGPSADGGYYLIATSSDLPADASLSLFTDIPWGTANVFHETLNRAQNKGLKTAILKELKDIDLPCDLEHFNHHSDPQ